MPTPWAAASLAGGTVTESSSSVSRARVSHIAKAVGSVRLKLSFATHVVGEADEDGSCWMGSRGVAGAGIGVGAGEECPWRLAFGPNP